MDKASTTSGLIRTRSEQLLETMMAAIKPNPTGDVAEVGRTLSRKSSRRLTAPSPGRSGRINKNTHIRTTRSAQLKLDFDDVSSGAALSRASSASLGFSFSFTGFTVPSDEITDLRHFSDEDIPEDLEAGTRKKIIAEPTLPIYLKFTNVTYKVTIKGMTSKVEKDILNGITGSVNPGEVLALMGPSGSGKTTLLSLLGGRLKEAAPGGSITYDDQPYSKLLKSRIGFVTQDDVLFAHLTVKETLTYTALLRLPKSLTKQEKENQAMYVIEELGLERCQDTMIGGSFVRGVSGGERKRVSIGNEIIINPSVLFLDEPTSGLDSTTALRIVEILQHLAEAGKTVITTIHQPSSRLFHKFDKLILLGKGSLLYFGKATEAMPYFSSIGCSPLIAMNPAEFLIDLANGNINDVSVPSELEDKVQIGNSETETKNGKPSPTVVHEVRRPKNKIKNTGFKRTDQMQDISLQKKQIAEFKLQPNKLKIRMLERILGIHDTIYGNKIFMSVPKYLVEAYEIRVAYEDKKKLVVSISVDEGEKIDFSSGKREWGASWWEQFSILFKRGLKERRYDYFSWLKVTQVIVTAVILGLLWWQSDGENPQQLQDQAGLLFFIAVFWGFFPVFTAIFTFPQERAMLSKERAAGMYRFSAYFMARTTSDLPLDLVLPVLFLLLVYFMAGLRKNFESFFLTMVIVFLCIVAAQGLGLAIGATLMNLQKATTLASVTVMTFMLAGGYFVKDVPVFISWLRYLSFNYHTYKLLLKVQYEHIAHTINGVKIDSGVEEVTALLAMMVGYRLLAYLSLRRMKLHPGS